MHSLIAPTLVKVKLIFQELYLSLKNCQLDQYLDLRLIKGGHIDLSNTIIRDIIDLKPYYYPVEISSLNISGMRLIGRIYLSWESNQVRNMLEKNFNSNFAQLSEQYLTLKQNFNNIGQYDDEDNSYIMYRRYKSKAKLVNAKNKSKLTALFSYPIYLFKWFIFDLMGLYVISPSRVLKSVLTTWFVFGFIFYFIQYENVGATISVVGNPDHLSRLSRSLYHSAITFFTIGYGDVYPQGLSRLFSAIEEFIGVFLMSYFTVAFVRKVLR